MELRNELVKATLEIDELKAQITHQQLQELNPHNEKSSVSDQRDALMNILMRKDSTIKTMSSQLKGLELQLQSAVSGKLDAFDRLERIEAKDLTITIKEKQMDLEAKRLNNKIENLTDDLSRNVNELAAMRQELTLASTQFDADITAKSEQLRIANLNICELSQTIHELKVRNEEYVHNLNEQLNASRKLMQDYETDLNAKTDLAKLYKENSDHSQTHIEELTAGVCNLKRLLNESVDEYGILETKLQQIELDRQIRTDAADEIILKLKQELKDANCLLEKYVSSECGSENNHRSLTLTEIYTQYCDAVTALRNKDQEIEIFQMEMKNLIEDVKEKAVHFNEQRDELKNQGALNDKLNEEKNYLLVEKVVCREELESLRSKCELLKNENGQLKFYGSEYLKKLLPKPLSDGGVDVKADFPDINGNSELEQKNRILLAIAHDLVARINGMKRDDNVTVTSTVKCEEDLLKIEKLMQANRKLRNEVLAASREENSLKMEELRHDNNKLRNALRELNAEKNVLVEASSLFNAGSAYSQQQNEIREQQIEQYAITIEEHRTAYKILHDENKNVLMKLSTAENQLQQSQKLSDMKSSLVKEVETLKQELIQEKRKNEIRRELEQIKPLTEPLEMNQPNMDVASSVFTVVSVLDSTDTEIENGEPTGEALQMEKNMFLQSLQLTESPEPAQTQTTVETPRPQTTSSTKVNSQKRSNKELNASGSNNWSCPSICSTTPQSNKRARPASICDDMDSQEAKNLELEYLSEARTRKQAQLIHLLFQG